MITHANVIFSHNSTKHTGATANLLASINPTKTGWTQEPGTNADLTDELTVSNLTTQGISPAGGGSLIYDLGSSRRRIVYFIANLSIATQSLYFSDDNVTYYQATGNTALYTQMAIGKFRYLKFNVTDARTYTFLKLRCYNLN